MHHTVSLRVHTTWETHQPPGHYQSMLYEASPSLHSEEVPPNAPVAFSTDDGRTPRQCSSAEHDDALKNTYLVWLTKC